MLEISEKRLGLKDVEPDIIGRSYEYLIRKFTEGNGQRAGEFYAPIAKTLEKLSKKTSLHQQCCSALFDLFQTLLHQLMSAQIRVHDIAPPHR